MLVDQRGIPDLDLSKTTIRGAALLPRFFLCLLHTGDSQSGHDNAHHRHEFDQDVERGTRSVLERIADD